MLHRASLSNFFCQMLIGIALIGMLGTASVKARALIDSASPFMIEAFHGRAAAAMTLAESGKSAADKPEKVEKLEKADKPEKPEKTEKLGPSQESGQGSTVAAGKADADIPAVPVASDHQALDQQQALDAVESGKAMPLAEIVAAFTGAGLGEVIDADLVTISGILLYQLRIIDTEGVVRTIYYDAKSGRAVEAN